MAHPSTRVLAPLHTAWTALLDVVYPPCCAGCGARLADPAVPLCHRCLHSLERVPPDELAAHLARLPEAHTALDGAFVVWPFDRSGPVQRAQHRLKYGNRPHYGVALGQLLGTAYREAGFPLPDLVVPIPLHRVRLLERGYNQSAMLAQGVARALGVPSTTDVLERPRATRTQTRLSRTQRWANVAGAFAVPESEAVAQRRLLLIDDVLTTGATLTAAALALREAGATTVHAAALALARS